MQIKPKKAAIGQKILNPILLMVLFQIIILWLFVFQLGLFDSVIQQSRGFFLQNTLSNAGQIDNEMFFYFSDFSNFGKSISDLEKLYRDSLKGKAKFTLSPEIVSAFVSDSSGLHIDGIYLELFGTPEKESLHFRPAPEKKSELYADNFFVLPENTSAFFTHYVLNASTEPAAFREFLNEVRNADTRRNSFKPYGNGNWSNPISMDDGKTSVFYAIPLQYKKVTYGILAAEISLERFDQLLTGTSFPDNFPHQAILIRYDRKQKQYNALAKHAFYMDELDSSQLDPIVADIMGRLRTASQYHFEPTVHEQKYFCSGVQLPNASAEMDPFSTVRFYYLALSPESIVMHDVILLQRTFIFLIVLFILFSIIIALFITKQVVSPITVLTSAIEQKDLSSGKKHLPETAITEIDLLIDTLALQNQNIQNFHQMITDTMIASEINLVTFYTDKAHKITRGFGAFRALLGKSFSEDYILNFSEEEFAVLEQKIFQNFIPYSSHCSQTKDNLLQTDIYFDQTQNKYICVKSRDMQHGRTLVLLDYTANVFEQEQIKKERDHDVLTSLLNRFSFTEKATAYLNENPHKPVGMAMWDLDYLKQVNDTYGHDMGDLYLRTAGEILSDLDPQRSYVARVSGDEFFALLFDYESKDAMIADIQATHHKLNHAFITLNTGKKQTLSASCGYTYAVGETFEALKKNADSAMYDSKRSAKGSIHEFTS